MLARLVDEYGPPENTGVDRPEPSDHYGALVRTIVGQQLSTLAARSIYRRLIALFGDRPPTPQEILDYDPEKLRAAAGLSRAKRRTCARWPSTCCQASSSSTGSMRWPTTR